MALIWLLDPERPNSCSTRRSVLTVSFACTSSTASSARWRSPPSETVSPSRYAVTGPRIRNCTEAVACGRIPSIISNAAAIRNARPDAAVSALSAAGNGACRYSADWEGSLLLWYAGGCDAEDDAQDGCGVSTRCDSGGMCSRGGCL